jgi:chemotaxis family two-component system sensor kinase Cph1
VLFRSFRGEKGLEIHIGAEQRPGEWRFSVRDNGIGMEPEMIPKLFQPSQRLHGAGPYLGSGLGLSIAKKIMTRHGGRIWVESVPGEGSVFYFTVPVSETTEPGRS